MEKIIYDTIGSSYNSTRQADPEIADILYRNIASGADEEYLDIGCGTGNYTTALSRKGLTFTGVDPSRKMLDEARSRNPKIKWMLGSAEDIPASDKLFAGITGTLTLHHWSDYHRAFAELNRVLKENGKITFFTSTPEQMKGYWLNYYFPVMLQASIEQMPSLEVIDDAAGYAGLQVSGTQKYFIQDNLQDHFLYVGKNRPALYFNEGIRKGISSFSALANRDEVQKGLADLSQDLKNGHFDSIKKEYQNELGDYLFISFIKK